MLNFILLSHFARFPFIIIFQQILATWNQNQRDFAKFFNFSKSHQWNREINRISLFGSGAQHILVLITQGKKSLKPLGLRFLSPPDLLQGLNSQLHAQFSKGFPEKKSQVIIVSSS